MTLQELIAQLRKCFSGFNEPAENRELVGLQKTVGPLPDDVLELYQDHNGCERLPAKGDVVLAARLMPIAEAIELHQAIAEPDFVKAGDVAWLWTDDNGNYAGVYTNGLLEGWWVKADHEEPILTPCWRSCAGFLTHLLESAPDVASKNDQACDLVMIPREVPVLVDDPKYLRADRLSVAMFRELLEDTKDEDLRRFYAQCAIALTPVADTLSLLAYLAEDDMWIPESAIHLLELREYSGPVEEIERLARDGTANGDSAAIRLLVRMSTAEARDAVQRLRNNLKGQKKQRLDWDIENRHRLQPPRRY